MRPYRARFREQGAFFAFQSWASCIINIFGLDLRQAQGCAPFAHGSEGRAYSSPSNPGRAASPIYSDLICDRHSRRLLGFVSVRLVKGTVVFDPQYPNLKTDFFLDFSCADLVMVGWA